MKSKRNMLDGAGTPPSAASKQPHACIIENDKDSRDLLQMILEMEGYAISAFEDGAQYFAQQDVTSPDLVIINVPLTAEDGIEVLRQVRQEARSADLPIIVTSSYPSSVIKVKALQAGGDTFLAKPIDSDELGSLIKYYFHSQEDVH